MGFARVWLFLVVFLCVGLRRFWGLLESDSLDALLEDARKLF